MEIVYDRGWMQVIKRENRVYIRYNSGDMINSIDEIEVSISDAINAQEGDQIANEIIIKYQNLRTSENL